MFKKITALILALLTALFVLAGCGPQSAGTDRSLPSIKITDMLGREVEVPAPANKVVAIGPGALKLVCYVNGAGKVVGI